MPRLAALAAVPLLALTCAAQTPGDARFARWEKEVAGVEARLKADPPPADPVVFAGSSTIRLWDLKTSFPGKGYVNVGFGGAEVRDCTHFAHRLVGSLTPATVVFYAGDNDINSKRTAEQVRDDVKAFVAAVHADAPKARVLFVAVKPSVARWPQYPTQAKANALVREFCGTDPRLGFVDVAPALLGPGGGKPAADFFQKDGLHLSPKGYAVVSGLVAKALER